MRAYLAIKYHPDMSNRELIESLSECLAKSGVDAFCVVRDVESWGEQKFSPAELMKRSFEAIESCDFVLLELSEKGVGLGIEAGFAWARKIPVITIARAGSDVSATLQGISRKVLFYTEETISDVCGQIGLCARQLTIAASGAPEIS